MVERLFAVKVYGSMRMVRYFYRFVLNAQGIIFNTGSTAAVFSSVNQAACCAIKAALYQYANVLRITLASLEGAFEAFVVRYCC